MSWHGRPGHGGTSVALVKACEHGHKAHVPMRKMRMPHQNPCRVSEQLHYKSSTKCEFYVRLS